MEGRSAMLLWVGRSSVKCAPEPNRSCCSTINLERHLVPSSTMQAFQNAARLLANNLKGTRSMTTKNAEDFWAGYFPKTKPESVELNTRNVRKEMIGFLLLGPIGGALMIYDFIYGLESHSDNVIPPYPWCAGPRHAARARHGYAGVVLRRWRTKCSAITVSIMCMQHGKHGMQLRGLLTSLGRIFGVILVEIML